jgi:hypothetical protein
MMAESDLLMLFGRESLCLVPVAWKELHEQYPTLGALGAFLTIHADEPYRYRPAKWYRYLPKTGIFYTRDVDAESVKQWIWYFPSDDGFTDSQLDAILARALDWALGQGVASITLTFPPLLRNASSRILRTSGRRLRMRKVMDFMRLVELETGILVGMVAKKAEVKNG